MYKRQARVFRGRAALISPEWYPVFRAAFETHDDLEARYLAGHLDSMTRRVYRCFAERAAWPRHELTARLRVGKADKSRFETVSYTHLILIISIFPTENALKKTFREDGTRRNL